MKLFELETPAIPAISRMPTLPSARAGRHQGQCWCGSEPWSNFSDVGGRHMLSFDDSPGSRNNLVGGIEMLRCDLDTDGRDWLHVGNFTPTERKPAKKKRAERCSSESRAVDIVESDRGARVHFAYYSRQIRASFSEMTSIAGKLTTRWEANFPTRA